MGYRELWHRLTPLYDDDEAKAIVRWVLEAAFDLSATDIYCGKVEQLEALDLLRLEAMMQRLEKAEPVQYVLGTADFCGRPFHVEPGVLIPRPETEGLCRWITHGVRNDVQFSDNCTSFLTSCAILDIGTGSGCIAVTLALDIPNSDVTAWDISDEAIHIAQENAESAQANVTFEKRDALNLPSDTARWDIIVSNPPYIDEATERETMAANVLEYEPHEALFGPTEEPDLFYRRIGDYASESLKPGGQLYFELNPRTAEHVSNYLQGLGFQHVEMRLDQFGKQRFLKATKI